MNIVTVCPLCGAEAQKDVYHAGELHYVACARCSLVFLHARPTEEELAAFYASHFQDKRRNLTTVEEAVARLESKGSYEEKKEYIPYLAPYLTTSSQCLEIGGGWGTFGKVLQDAFGCRVDEVEPSHLAAEVARTHYGLTVFPVEFSSFVEHDGKDKTYDAVILVHVFEHLTDPNAFLENAKRVLKKEGVLFFALPDVLNPDGPSERFYHFEHCFYYSPKTMELLLAKHGFRILKLWRTKSDMRLVCVPDAGAAATSFDNAEYADVMAATERVEKKYALLRRVKNVTSRVLNQEQLARVSKAAARVLSALGVIKV